MQCELKKLTVDFVVFRDTWDLTLTLEWCSILDSTATWVVSIRELSLSRCEPESSLRSWISLLSKVGLSQEKISMKHFGVHRVPTALVYWPVVLRLPAEDYSTPPWTRQGEFQVPCYVVSANHYVETMLQVIGWVLHSQLLKKNRAMCSYETNRPLSTWVWGYLMIEHTSLRFCSLNYRAHGFHLECGFLLQFIFQSLDLEMEFFYRQLLDEKIRGIRGTYQSCPS